MSVDAIKVGMIIVMEPDLEKSVKFFKDLGFPLKFHLEEKWAEFAIGDVKMGLCPTSSEVIEHHTGVILEVPEGQEKPSFQWLPASERSLMIQIHPPFLRSARTP